jgi:integrase
VGVHYDPSRRKYTVRWTEDRRRRIRRFDQEVDALQFASRLAEPNSQMAAGTPSAAARASKAPRDGIYRYETKAGPRWRFVFIQSDGTRSSRRGFVSRSVAKVEKRRIADEIRRRERVVTRDTFDEFWTRWIRERRPYLSPGSFEDLVTHGHKRLVAYFGDDRLSSIDDARVRGWMASMLTLVERGELAPETVNNARACLSTALKEAARRGLISRNPCDAVRQLPVAQVELEYLRMHEIGPYLSACSRHYRPLAEFLIGTGTRVSEAIAVRWADIDLDGRMVLIQRQRGRGGAQDTAATKGRRFRSVQLGPRLTTTLAEMRAAACDDDGWVFVRPLPRRGRHARKASVAPPHRKTVHDWHEAALRDAGLRDMPLHALRHTAAAAWLAAGNPLIFVQRQLGHRSITTTETYYGHLESSFVRDAAALTEAAIQRAGARRTEGRRY